MGSVYKQGTRYWIKYYLDGRPVRESTRTDDKEQAKRLLKGREGAAALGAPIPPRLDKITYDELAKDLRMFYETTGKRRLAEVDDRLAYLNTFFRGRRAAAITPALVTEYVARRQQDKTRFKTVTPTVPSISSSRSLSECFGSPIRTAGSSAFHRSTS